MLTKETVKRRIQQNKSKIANLGIDLIGLFGSYAREEQREDSDIDIFISFKEGHETFNNFMDLSYLLEDIFQGVKVEIVTQNGLSAYIGPKILKEVEYV
ncbi:nucleotidyltransferase family protein [Neolewinella lacunae]|uniref:Nucleotidyltransferase family protein n=1 Tax=Neolewinella lacunae TaxID=1517758 RepID=A0A923T8U9_9BACT|nr:nucleotidyltransferase family protein [Neolewinella lacunae]MBC6994944.1 nucleotidyltransferase family protein [Neolewinella lacunae]MDN3636112.1 nucleotidyltransferase family protein [Neolewinella lacunae]